MRLPRRIAGSALPEVLTAMADRRVTGVLSVDDPATRRRHRVHLREGRLTHVEGPDGCLGLVLRAMGALDAVAERMLERLVAGGDPRPVGRLLVEETLARGADVEAALAAQTRGRLDELVGLRAAELRFGVAGL